MAALRRFAAGAATAAGLSGQEITVQLVGPRTMRRWNREFRGRDYATDVLSFPSAPGEAGGGVREYLGDIAICPAAARENASDLAREIRVLMLHGLLHLMGYDHETDNGSMRRRELRLRRKLGLQ